MEFLGRLHPLLVHLPIGILLVAAAFAAVSNFKGFKSFKPASRVAIWLGAFSAVIACATGLLLANENYDTELLSRHKYSGFATGLSSLLLVWIYNSKKIFAYTIKSKFRLAFFFPLIILIFLTGHLGGSLTHGEGFLFPENSESPIVRSEIKTYDKKVAVYTQLIQPLLEERCYRCHSSKKQKGKLRLDNPEFIMKGGKDGVIINSTNLPQSQILTRIHLPIEDEDHMPPSDNDQLSSGEIDLLTNWVESGASFSALLSDLKDSVVYVNFIKDRSTKPNSAWWPDQKIDPPDPGAVTSLKRSGVAIDFLSDGNNYLQISMIGIDTFPSEVWKDLLVVKDHIISLRLSQVAISSVDLENISELKNLRKLFLDKALPPNASLGKLSGLDDLTYLNLSDNSISDSQISEIGNIKSLKTLILFGTNLSRDVIQRLKDLSPGCKIESGQYQLPVLTTDTLIYRK